MYNNKYNDKYNDSFNGNYNRDGNLIIGKRDIVYILLRGRRLHLKKLIN